MKTATPIQDKLIGKTFILNNFICTVTRVTKKSIHYTFTNRAGGKFDPAELDNDYACLIMDQCGWPKKDIDAFFEWSGKKVRK